MHLFKRPSMYGAVSGLVLAVAWLAAPLPAQAECMVMDEWPRFRDGAVSASRIVVGEVDKSYFDDSADNAIEFHVAVTDVLRGAPSSGLDFRGGTRTDPPPTECPGDSILRVRVGDVLAIAFDGTSDTPMSVRAVAWIRGRPPDFLMPGAEVIALRDARAAAALPQTDTSSTSPRSSSLRVPLVPLLFGAASGWVVLRRTGLRSGVRRRSF